MQDFSNNLIDFNDIPAYEEVPLTQINPNYKKVVVYNYLSIILFQIIIAIAVYFIDVFYFKPFAFAVLGVVLVTVLLAILNVMVLKYRSFAFRDHDIISQQGFVYKSQIVVPNNRIQHISINQGVFSKMFNLCNLQIYTASTNSADIVIRGLNYNDALQYKQLILNKIKPDQDAE